MTASEALALFSCATFTPFTDHDWECWAGCESENPLVAYFNAPGYGDVAVILDGSQISVTLPEDHGDVTFFTFNVTEA